MFARTDTFRRVLLGSDSGQRLRASQSLLALAVYAIFAVVQTIEVCLGMVDDRASLALNIWNLAGGFGFFLLIRGGLNLRLQKDRALAVPQSLWAMAGIAWSYGITGPARGGVMLIMLLVILFGMFSLKPGQARLLAFAGFAMLAMSMGWKAITDPTHYEPKVEAVHFVFAGIVMGATAELAVRIGKLRAQLQKQRTDLAGALERIQRLATHDELTGLLNRRAVLDRLQFELRDRRVQWPRVCVALIDLDHFKRINDSCGHAAGDEVLRRFAEVSREGVRTGDVLARWGGEEFLLVMAQADVEQALCCLTRIRETLMARRMDDIQAGLAVTFSAGVAECSNESDIEPAIERADRAMYEAKRSGRNRTVAAEARHQDSSFDFSGSGGGLAKRRPGEARTGRRNSSRHGFGRNRKSTTVKTAA